MNAKDHCPECGRVLPKEEPDGRCPSCLFRLALLDEPASTDSAATSENSIAAKRIGEYEIIEEIARGGMGVVYKARQRGLNRIVALKSIASQKLATPEMVLRFQMEIKAIAKLDHPNIVPLYEMGEHEGVQFFTMKLAEGGNLSDRITQAAERGHDAPHQNGSGGRVPGGRSRKKRELVSLLIKVCRSVHHAHQRGILHRDLKPGNILLDERGEPHVSDFGLAKILEKGSSITRTESILGSPNYMAPEQAGANGESVTIAADVYSLGAILYEILTGDPPFKAGTPLETIRRVIEEDPRQPSAVDSGVDRDLETICLRCLAKEPARRYASADDLADDLERWMNGEPILARPATLIEQTLRWARRNPAVTIACAAILASLTALAIGSAVAAARIAAANEATESLLARSQAQEAEGLFAADRFDEGLALLAHVARKRPGDLDVARRLASALSHRRFARPAYAPLKHDSGILDTVILDEAGLVQTITQGGTIHRWTLAGGRSQPPGLTIGKDLSEARFARNGSRVAVLTQNHEIEVWSISDEVRKRAALGHPELVRAAQVAISPGGRLVAACSLYSDALYIFDAESGQLVQALGTSGNIVGRFSFSNDERKLAHGLANGRVLLWDLATGQELPCELRHESVVLATGFSPDDRFLASGADDQTARCWDLWEGKLLPWLARHRNQVDSISFLEDGERLITGSRAAGAYVWDMKSGGLDSALSPSMSVSGIAISAKSELVCSAFSNELWTWQLREASLAPALVQVSEGYVGLEFSPSGEQMVTGESDGTLRFWNAQTGGTVAAAMQHPAGTIPCVTFHPSGQLLAAAIYESAAWIRRLETGEAIRLPHESWVRTTKFDRSGNRLVTASHDGTARIWEVASGEPLGPALQHEDEVWYAEFSPDGESVVTASRDATARIWEAATGKELASLQHLSMVATAQFDRTGRYLATASYDLRARLWPLDRGGLPVDAARPVQLPHHAMVVWLEFSPDGRWLATASFDHTARIWDVQTGRPQPFSLRHAAPVVWVAFSPDGAWVVTASRDKTARVWSVATGQPITEPLRHAASLCRALFSPNGRTVATASNDGTVKLWALPQIDPGDSKWLSDLAELVSRRSTEANGYSIPLAGDSLTSRRTRLETWVSQSSLAKWFLEEM